MNIIVDIIVGLRIGNSSQLSLISLTNPLKTQAHCRCIMESVSDYMEVYHGEDVRLMNLNVLSYSSVVYKNILTHSTHKGNSPNDEQQLVKLLFYVFPLKANLNLNASSAPTNRCPPTCWTTKHHPFHTWTHHPLTMRSPLNHWPHPNFTLEKHTPLHNFTQ